MFELKKKTSKKTVHSVGSTREIYVQSEGFQRNRQLLKQDWDNPLRGIWTSKIKTVILSLLRCKRVFRWLNKIHSIDSLKYRVNKQKYVQSEGFHRNRQSFQKVRDNPLRGIWTFKLKVVFWSLLRCKRTLKQLKKKRCVVSPKYRVNKQKHVQSEGFHRNRKSFQKVQDNPLRGIWTFKI